MSSLGTCCYCYVKRGGNATRILVGGKKFPEGWGVNEQLPGHAPGGALEEGEHVVKRWQIRGGKKKEGVAGMGGREEGAADVALNHEGVFRERSVIVLQKNREKREEGAWGSLKKKTEPGNGSGKLVAKKGVQTKKKKKVQRGR